MNLVKPKQEHFKKAFTLVELLVVVLIISILAVLVVVNFNRAKARSNDAQRKSDLTKIASALEIYKTENKYYMSSVESPAGSGNYIKTTINNANASASTPLSPVYLPVIPADPLDSTTYYGYRCNKQEYKVWAKSETIVASTPAEKVKLLSGDFFNPPDGTYFQVSNTSTALAW